MDREWNLFLVEINFIFYSKLVSLYFLLVVLSRYYMKLGTLRVSYLIVIGISDLTEAMTLFSSLRRLDDP